MKFVYVDESGDQGQSDIFVMAGLLIDAYRLPKYTAQFDKLISSFLAKHPGAPKELKTKAFINGNGGWSQVDPRERKEFLGAVCDLAVECARVFAIAFSFENIQSAMDSGYRQPFNRSHWLSASMFIAALVQKKMQKQKGNKGLTVLICDDNKQEMPTLSDALYEADPWFDPIYQASKPKSGKTVWKPVPDENRFDSIVNSAFAIKSHQSSLIQVADAASYVYRRHLELTDATEAWEGEQNYYHGLVRKVESRRQRLGRTPGGPCIDFYQAACHKEWEL